VILCQGCRVGAKPERVKELKPGLVEAKQRTGEKNPLVRHLGERGVNAETGSKKKGKKKQQYFQKSQKSSEKVHRAWQKILLRQKSRKKDCRERKRGKRKKHKSAHKKGKIRGKKGNGGR